MSFAYDHDTEPRLTHQMRLDAALGKHFFQSPWWETVLLVIASSLLLLVMTQPAFKSFFFGENFLYVGQFRAQGNNYWRAVLSPTDNIFFRPLCGAIELLWYFILPLDPWVYHVRNFIFSGINLLLLYRVLLRLVVTRAARILALFFFALSKVHLTAIGYVTIYDSIIMLALLLSTLLFFLRYIVHHRTLDYGLGLLFCFLSLFTRDYGMVIVAVVAVLVGFRGLSPGAWPTLGGWWALRLTPLPVMVLFYLGLRYGIVGPLPSSNLPSSHLVYSPQLSFDVTARKVLVFTSTMANLSFADLGTTGASGLGLWLTAAPPGLGLGAGGINLPGLGLRAGWVDIALYVGFMALLLGTLVFARCVGMMLLFPLTWMVAYFGPTLLTRNLQMYYMYEPLAGMTVLLGMCLDRASRRLLGIWGLALVIIGVNGAISNYNSVYHWQYVASLAQKIQKPVLEAYRGQPIESITFITAPASRAVWEYTLVSDYKGPMIPELMKLPNLKVRLIDYQELRTRQAEANERNLFFDIDNGFSLYDRNQVRSPLILNAISPVQTRVGTGFNVQPNGQSAISITAEHATPGTVVIMREIQLVTTYGNERWLTALVPVELLARPGRYSVYLSNGVSESNRLEFVVEP